MTRHAGPDAGAQYFVLEDAEKKRRIAQEMQKKLDAEQREALRALHHMHCPKCGMPLQTMRMQTAHHGDLDVDACFACGGVFLDRKDIAAIAAPRQKGIMAAVLNWFDAETHHPVK